MKLSLFAICSLATGLTVASAKSLDGVQDLVRRRIPKHANSFSFEFMDGPGDAFEVSDSPHKNGKIAIKCTLVSGCARGLYEYLRARGGVAIWWTGSRLNQLPSRLPPVGPNPITGSSVVKHRYYFNTVTFSYTTAFWPFDETRDSGSDNWSHLLDWLALHGVNLPLAWDGYEYILTQVYREAGLSDSEIREYFSGPAFEAWNRFGNIKGSWGGDLPEQWVTDQFVLQKQIIKRMVSLGMTPALSSFTGFVPNALKTHFPDASIITESQWSGFPVSLTNVSFLDPEDVLFKNLQTSFITKQQEAYGADVTHVYTLDQYNENTPLQDSLEYLHNVSSNTIATLRAADPQAIWLMQAWLFFSDSAFWTTDRINAYLGGIPNDAALILDLYSEAQPEWNRTNSYGGKEWIWCELHGFGANIGIEGNLATLTTEPLKALNSPGSSMNGVGLTMEGQDQGNEIVYGLLLDQAWSKSPIDLSAYLSSFVSQRYLTKPSSHSAMLQAWNILASSVYNNTDPDSQATVKSVFVLAPSLTGLTNRTGHHPTKIFYNTNDTIVPALKLLVQASKETKALRSVPEFAYDVVNLARQVLANYFIDLYDSLVATYNSDATAAEVANAGQALLDILSDIDDVLMTNENFLLSRWIRSARTWGGNNQTYANYLEYNARNQISLWGPEGQINDYAAKDWGGMVHSYYLRRWTAFVRYLEESKKSATPYNATAVAQEMLAIGEEWDNEIWGARPGETWGTRGDTWDVVDKVLKRWVS